MNDLSSFLSRWERIPPRTYVRNQFRIEGTVTSQGGSPILWELFHGSERIGDSTRWLTQLDQIVLQMEKSL